METTSLLGPLLGAMVAFGCATTRDEHAAPAPPPASPARVHAPAAAPPVSPSDALPLPENARDKDGWYALSPELPQSHGVALHDLVRGRVVLVTVDYGCWLWTWENDRWVRERRLADSISGTFLAYFDPRRRSVVIGYEDAGGPEDRRRRMGWSFFAANEPDKRWRAPLPVSELGDRWTWAYDAARGRLIVDGGGSTWAVRDGRVARIGPPQTSIMDMAYDASQGRIVAVSTWADMEGRGGSELMVLGAKGWRSLGEHPSWTGSRLGQDPASGRVIQFRADGRDDPKGGMVLFELHGDQWRRREPLWRSLLTSGSTLVSNGDELLLHGGQDFRGGANWTGRTWSCRAASCREALTRFELPEPYRTASLVSSDGTTLYVNHETLAVWALGAAGWRAWGPARAPEDALLSRGDALRTAGLEIPEPLFASWGRTGLHLLASDGGLWRATGDRALAPQAPAAKALADDGHHAGHHALAEEPRTGRLIAGLIRPTRFDQTAGTIWAFAQDTWTRLDDVPGLAALASAPDGVLALTSNHRLLRLAGSRWVELSKLADTETEAVALFVAQTDGRVFALLGSDSVAAVGPDGYRPLFTLPEACRALESPLVALDDKAKRWTALCRDALYTRPLDLPPN